MRAQNALSRLLLGTLLGFACSLPGMAYAADKKAAPPAPPAAPSAPGAKDEKVDISDLENKYWAPKDTDFSVVQNRTYTKEKRYFLSLQYGIPTSDPYNSGSFTGITANYYLTERHGVQLTYLKANLSPNSAVKDLLTISTGVYPDHGRMNDYLGLGYSFVPFYSKMSFMGKKIIYFDMAFTPTLGLTKYDQIQHSSEASATSLTYGLDITQYFFFSNHFAFRFDWKNQWYSQDVLKYKFTNIPSPTAEGTSMGAKTIHDSILLLGATFFW